MKIVRAIRQGKILPNKPKASSQIEFYSIWSSEPSTSQQPPLPAPKPPLPTHSESYNPPEEYLPTEEERKEWEEQDPEDRQRNYLPKKYTSLRLVPAYDQFIKQRFNRQLDLYLAPRVQRVKLNIDPNSLIPKLPSPSSLKPFPNHCSLQFTHSTAARCTSVSPDGHWVVSGGEDGAVSLWETNVGREIRRWKFPSKIGCVEWCPRTDVSYFMVGMWVFRLVTLLFMVMVNLVPIVRIRCIALYLQIFQPRSKLQPNHSWRQPPCPLLRRRHRWLSGHQNPPQKGRHRRRFLLSPYRPARGCPNSWRGIGGEIMLHLSVSYPLTYL
jgi:ribosome biogenesis protein ERB1